MQGRRAEECQGRESREGKLTIPALAGGVREEWEKREREDREEMEEREERRGGVYPVAVA